MSFAWSILSQNWRTIWGVLALNALSWTVLFAGLFSGRQELFLAGALAMMITKYPLYGAIFRLGAGHAGDARPEFKLGAQGLQWGAMELRMLAADLLLSVFTLILFTLLLVALGVVLTGVLASGSGAALKATTPQQVMQALGPQGRAYLQAAQLALFVVMLFVTTRLLLALPASALSGRIAVLRTWKLTRGAFLRLFAAWVVVQAPVWLTTSLAAAGVSGALTSFTPAQILGYSVLSGVLAGAASTPLCAGVQAYFYKALSGAAATAGASAKAEGR